MIELDVKSVQTLDIESESEDKVNQILNQNMEFIMDTYFIPEVKAAARASNVPQGFVEGIKFVQTGDNRGNIINTWGSEEKPLALWFNYGTKDHGSLGNWPLHWKDKTTGEDIYAMYVRGVPKTLAMETGIELGKKRLIQEVPRFVEARL